MEPVFTEACGSLLLHHPKVTPATAAGSSGLMGALVEQKGQMTLPGSDQAKQQLKTYGAGTLKLGNLLERGS